MKKYLLAAAAILAALVTGCNKGPETEPDPIEISLTVTGIENNCATIKASLTSGEFHGAKLIESINLEAVTIDYKNDIQLIKFVTENGVDVTLPYEKQLTGIRIGQDQFTALIVFDETGRVDKTATVVWTPAGKPDGWSEENTPGKLDEITW